MNDMTSLPTRRFPTPDEARASYLLAMKHHKALTRLQKMGWTREALDAECLRMQERDRALGLDPAYKYRIYDDYHNPDAARARKRAGFTK